MLSAGLSRLRRSAFSRLTYADVNPLLKRAEYAVLGPMHARSDELKQALAGGARLPFSRTIPCHVGNPYAVGKPVLTFPRQVLAIAEYPVIARSGFFPDEAVHRALSLVGLGPTSPILGCYSPPPGHDPIRANVARFHARRDGHPSDFRCIFLTEGATSGILDVFRTIIAGPEDGVLAPVPNYPIYSAAASLTNATLLPYDLIEDRAWALDRESLVRCIRDAAERGVRPKACVVVSPSNPSGTILSRDDMQYFVDVCEAEGILLIADEVYQENVYEGARWQSFRKVAIECGSKVQLMSINSISKGFFGECGHRSGYLEFLNVGDAVIEHYLKTVGINLPANTAGQVLLDVLVNPPTGPVCGKIWKEERDGELRSLEKRALQLERAIARLPGLVPQPAMGAMYLFPRLELPKRFIAEVKNATWRGAPMEPDLAWCMRLVNEEGIVTLPGSGFGQKEGTYHARITFLPSEQNMTDVVERLSRFQTKFMNQYAD
jgi:alanine transaminase